MNQLIQIIILLTEKNIAREKKRQEDTVMFKINDDDLDLNMGLSFESELDQPSIFCLTCNMQYIRAGGTEYYPSTLFECHTVQPKICLTRSVISANDGRHFISKKIIVDGDPILIDREEFDLFFYLHYSQLFIQSETEFITFLNQFDASFQPNAWYQSARSGLLFRLISDSMWSSAYLKYIYGCLHHEDGLAFLINEELSKYGYEPLIKAFKIKYANTSTSIVTDAEVAHKLEEWMHRYQFNEHINQLFENQILNYKSRKKRYFDEDIKQWRENDGSLEAKKKIFLSQYKRYPEFEAKRQIIQKLIRKAENEVRIEKGYSIVGTLVNESILFSKLKQHFPTYNVISQYRPKWLGRQSLDIFIEDLNVAIEYQGDQHTRPVEFFGGEAAYLITKQRDQKKLNLCKRNGCRLVYVYPGYTFEELILQIIEC